MEWLKRLGAAIDYIEENLDKEISYDEAAHIACCSTYYFQRIFSYVSGVSLSEYIRRRKMTQAAFELQRTDNKVIDVAHKYGYSSPTSFNRAFQSVHGIAPIAAKSMGCTLCAYPSIQFSIIVLGGSAMAYHIEEKKSIRIIGIRIPLVEDAEENMRNVPAFWKKAVLDGSISKLAELSNKNPDGILGVSVYNNPEDIYYYIAVSSNIPVPEGMVEYMIPEGMWVVFENDGVFKEDVQSVFRRFLTEFLPFSGYEYAGLPDVEIYPVCKGQPSKGHSEVWIAIKKAKELGAEGIQVVGSKFVIWRKSEKLAQEKKKAAARKPAKKKPSGNDNPVKAGLRARKQAAEQQRKQRKQYFHDKAVSAAIERSRQQKEEQ